MTDSYRKARVFVQNRFAGILEETDEGYSFKYDGAYLNDNSVTPIPVSLTLPISSEEYLSPVLFPFFDGLIPEGWLLEILRHNWKISSNDRFGLLLASCRDSVGDVYVEEV